MMRLVNENISSPAVNIFDFLAEKKAVFPETDINTYEDDVSDEGAFIWDPKLISFVAKNSSDLILCYHPLRTKKDEDADT